VTAIAATHFPSLTDPRDIPSSYWRRSLRPAYRGASQEALDALLEECRAAEATKAEASE